MPTPLDRIHHSPDLTVEARKDRERHETSKDLVSYREALPGLEREASEQRMDRMRNIFQKERQTRDQFRVALTSLKTSLKEAKKAGSVEDLMTGLETPQTPESIALKRRVDALLDGLTSLSREEMVTLISQDEDARYLYSVLLSNPDLLPADKKHLIKRIGGGIVDVDWKGTAVLVPLGALAGTQMSSALGMKKLSAGIGGAVCLSLLSHNKLSPMVTKSVGAVGKVAGKAVLYPHKWVKNAIYGIGQGEAFSSGDIRHYLHTGKTQNQELRLFLKNPENYRKLEGIKSMFNEEVKGYFDWMEQYKGTVAPGKKPVVPVNQEEDYQPYENWVPDKVDPFVEHQGKVDGMAKYVYRAMDHLDPKSLMKVNEMVQDGRWDADVARQAGVSVSVSEMFRFFLQDADQTDYERFQKKFLDLVHDQDKANPAVKKFTKKDLETLLPKIKDKLPEKQKKGIEALLNMNLSGMYIGTMVLATILGTGYMALVKGFQKLRGRVDSFGKNRAEKRGATPSAKDLSLKDRKALKNSLLQTPNNATKALLGVALGGGALGLLVKKGVLNPYHSKKIRDTLKAKDKDGRESAAKSFFELFGGTSQEELGFIQDTKDLKEVRENFKRELVDWYQNYLGIEESLESHKYFELQDQVQDLRHKLQSTKPELATPQLSILVKGQAAPLLLRNIHLPLNSVLPQIPDGNFRTSFNKGNGVKFSSGVEKNGKIDNKKSSPFAIYEKDGTMFLAVSRSFRGTRVGAFSKQVFEIKKISTASEGFTQGDLEKPKDPNRISEGRVDLDGFTSGQDVNFSRGFGKDRLLKKTKHLGSKLERSGISQEMIGSLSKDSKNLLVDEIVTRIAHPNIKISDKNALKKSLLSALGNVRKKA